ncbi:kinase-like domain-containing protein [Mycena galericulata]|nr:kinase-like domain-containing protein [Mycena galericulata]
MDAPTPASSSQQQRPRPTRDPSPRLNSDYIAIKRPLGHGHNATVYLVEYNSDPIPRAMKKIARNNKRTENMNRLRANNPGRVPPLPRTADPSALVDRRGTEEAKIRREIAIMKKCDHPNIIKFFSFIDDQRSASICLIMEYMEGGELQWQSADREPYLTMDQTRRCMRDVVLGLQYLHLQGIIHRDIKPSNIMWTADRSHVKIGDFGVAHLVDSPASSSPDLDLDAQPRHAGTPAFLAPEIAPGGDAPMGDVTPAVDLWALGVTLFCMLFGRMPFDPAEGAQSAGPVAAEASLYRAIREDDWARALRAAPPEPPLLNTMSAGRVPVRPADWAPGGVLHLLARLLEKDPARRAGIDEVKASIDVLRWPSAASASPSYSPPSPTSSAPASTRRAAPTPPPPSSSRSSSPPPAPRALTPLQDSTAPAASAATHPDGWLLHGVQRRTEWLAATTPRIEVSAADEANAILEPKYKWNLIKTTKGGGSKGKGKGGDKGKDGQGAALRTGFGLGRRLSNFFRSGGSEGGGAGGSGGGGGSGKRRAAREDDGTGAVWSEPSVRVSAGESRKDKSKGKGKARADPDKDKRKGPPKDQQKAKPVDAPPPPPPSSAPSVPPSAAPSAASASSTARSSPTGFFRWPVRGGGGVFRGRTGMGAEARHSTEALGSAPMAMGMARPLGVRNVGGGGLAAEQRTASMTNARAGVGVGMGMQMGVGGDGDESGEEDEDGEDEDEDGEDEGEAKGMIAVPRAVGGGGVEYGTRSASPGSASESGSACSYGSGARVRGGYQDEGEEGLYGGEGDEDADDDDDDGPRGDVYGDDDDDESGGPITIKRARARAPPLPPPPLVAPPLNGHRQEADGGGGPPDSEPEPDEAHGPGL